LQRLQTRALIGGGQTGYSLPSESCESEMRLRGTAVDFFTTIYYNERTMAKETEYPTSVRITAELRAALQRRADADGRKLTNYIANVLRLHVENTPEPPAKRTPKPRKA